MILALPRRMMKFKNFWAPAGLNEKEIFPYVNFDIDIDHMHNSKPPEHIQ